MKTALDFSLKKNFSINKITKSSNHIKTSKLPYNMKKYFSKKILNKILSFMTKDKKNNSDKINLILLKKLVHQ